MDEIGILRYSDRILYMFHLGCKAICEYVYIELWMLLVMYPCMFIGGFYDLCRQQVGFMLYGFDVGVLFDFVYSKTVFRSMSLEKFQLCMAL